MYNEKDLQEAYERGFIDSSEAAKAELKETLRAELLATLDKLISLP